MLKPDPKRLTKGLWWDVQWNPWIGCTPVGPACDHCWARREEDGRFRHLHRCFGPVDETPLIGQTRQKYFDRGPVYQGDEELHKPLHWRKPRVIGVCMRSDLFHEDLGSVSQIAAAFSAMARCPQHLFIVPTKRTARAADWFATDQIPVPFYDEEWSWPLPNVWLLASVWDQDSADRLIPPLLECPAALRGISYEPALGPLDLSRWLPVPDRDGHCSRCGLEMDEAETHECPPGFGPILNWVIAGGESGPKARPSKPLWFRNICDQCDAAGVPFFFKQHGEWAPCVPPLPSGFGYDECGTEKRHEWHCGHEGAPPERFSIRVGKNRAGRLIYGVQRDGWPEDKDVDDGEGEGR